MSVLDHFFNKVKSIDYGMAGGWAPPAPEPTPEPDPTPIETFALKRIFEKTGGIDTAKSDKLGYTEWSYRATLFVHEIKFKMGDSPDLHTKRVETKIWYTNYNSSINISDYEYIDGECYPTHSHCHGFHLHGGPYDTDLDHPTWCAMLNDNWPAFLAALDSIAEQIKHDCDETFTREKKCCKKEILEKIAGV